MPWLGDVQPETANVASIRILQGRGFALGALGRHSEGIPFLHKAAELAEEIGWRAMAAFAWQRAALLEASVGKHDSMLTSSERARAQFEALDWHGDVVDVMFGVGESYRRRRAIDKACATYEEALAYCEQHKLRRHMARTLGDLGMSYLMGRRLAEARSAMERGMQLAEELEAVAIIAGIANDLAQLHHAAGEPAKAMECFERYRDIAVARGDKPRLAIALQNIGSLLAQLGDVSKGLETLERSLAVSREINSSLTTAEVLTTIGGLRRSMGEFDLARECLAEARSLLEASDNLPGLTTLFLMLAKLQRDTDELSLCEQSARKAMQLARKLGWGARAASAEHILGDALLKQGRLKEARRHLKRALMMIEMAGDPMSTAGARTSLGIYHLKRGERTKARRHLKKALAVAEKAGNQRGIATVLLDLAHAYPGPQGIEYHARSARIWEELGDLQGIALSVQAMAWGHLRANEYDKAEPLIERVARSRKSWAFGVWQRTRCYCDNGCISIEASFAKQRSVWSRLCRSSRPSGIVSR